MRRVATVLLAVALAGCGGKSDESADAQATDIPKAVSARPAAPAAVENQYATPVKDRVATLGLLNKRNNETQDVVLKTGETRRLGNIILRLATCERTLPWEEPEEEGAFVQVFVQERSRANTASSSRS